MAASFPASVKSFTKRRDLLDIVLSADVNQIYDEVTEVEKYLGTYPNVGLGNTAGSYNSSTTTWNTVRDRIQNLEYGVYTAFTDRVKSTGGSQIDPSSTSVVGLSIQAKASQVADLFQAKNSSGTVITKITAAGTLQLNNSNVLSATGAATLTNKTISGTDNTLLNISPEAVIVSGTTDIQEYVEARPTVYYQTSAPIGVPTGTIWVDSSENVEPFDASALLLSSDPSVAVGVDGYRRINAATVAPTNEDGEDGDVWLQFI